MIGSTLQEQRVGHTSADGRSLVCGLRWQPLEADSAAARGRQLRELARDYSAPKLLVVSRNAADGSPERASVGLATLDEGQKLPRRAHSAAAAFAASLAGTDSPEAGVLCLRCPQGDAPQAVYVVIVAGGMPLADVIYPDPVAAHEVVRRWLAEPPLQGGAGVEVHSDDGTAFPAGYRIDWALLERFSDSRSAMVSPPVDVRALSLVLAAAVLVGGGLYGWSWYSDITAKSVQRALALAADPLPRYREALASQARSAGFDRDSLIATTRTLLRHPVRVAGWQLGSVVCDGEMCTSSWARSGGTVEGLQAALPAHTLSLRPPGTRSEDARLDAAWTTWSLPVQRAGLPDDVPGGDAATSSAASTLQTWSLATMAVTMNGAPALWPVVAGVPASLSAPGTLRATSLSVGSIPTTWIEDVVRQTPANVLWNSIEVTVRAGGDALSAVQFKLTGQLFARS